MKKKIILLIIEILKSKKKKEIKKKKQIQLKEKFKIEENIEKVDLKLNLYEVATNKTTIIETNNLVNGAELKKIFCEKNNISMDEYNIRMFFAGNEIANEHFIYQYHIKNDFKIQVLKSAKVTTNKKRNK